MPKTSFRDLRLRYADDYALEGLGVSPPAQPDWIAPTTGKIPIQHDWGRPRNGSFGGDQPNRLSYPFVCNVVDVKLAIPYILGFATIGKGGRLTRVPPIGDPDGLGMVARGISNFEYTNLSGVQALELPDTSDAAYNGVVYNNRISDFAGPYSFNQELNFEKKVAKLYRHAMMMVDFEHVRFNIPSDAAFSTGIVPSPTSPGQPVQLINFLGERDRFMLWNMVPGMEYISLKAGVLVWTEQGAAAGSPPIFANDPQKAVTGDGAGWVRSTGELKGEWYDLPGDAVHNLLDKCQSVAWPGNPGKNTPLHGAVNQFPFTVKIGDFRKTFDPETLLFQPIKTETKTFPHGFIKYNVFLTLSWRPEGWNRFLHFQTGQYLRARYTLNNALADVYKIVDFEQFFRFP